MVLNKCSVNIAKPDYVTNLSHMNFESMIYILLFIFLYPSVSAQAGSEKNYLRIDRSLPTENNDLTVTSIGGLLFNKNAGSHVDLSYLETDANGKGLTLDVGGSYVFRSKVSFFVGMGVALGYNWDNDDYIASYYPEVGSIYEVTKRFGLTVSGKRYFNLYDKPENIVKLGLLFSY
ncbi:MAG TPA: hypothetical protein ENJ87_06030 [Gammaproteobacteria bacterium]|nr:hypothetical protein [Gammaproteobacteria bacterium]